MNEVQRQLLADRIDEVSRRVDRYEKDIADLEKRLANKKARRDASKVELEELKQGIDW